MQLLSHDWILTPELKRQVAQWTPIQLAAAREELVVHTIGVHKHALQALTQGAGRRVITSSQRPRMCSPYVSITARTSACFEGKK